VAAANNRKSHGKDYPMKEKGLFPATGKKPSMSLSTTYYCIQLYEFPITVEIRHGLLSVQPATQE
jgi:hypothetical protein